MPRTVMVKATSRMPAHQAKVLAYRTRMMQADIEGGSEFELSQGDASPLLKAQWVEPATAAAAEAAPRRGPGRPRKTEAAPPAAEPAADDLETMTVPELRKRAEEQGHTLRSGYIPKTDLINLLEGRDNDALAQEDDAE